MRLFLLLLFFAADAAAAPRVLYHPQPVADVSAPQWTLRVDTSAGQSQLIIEGPRGKQSYNLARTPTPEGDTIFSFEKAADEKAVQDLLADVKSTYEAIGGTGPAAGSSALVGFINEIQRRDGAEGVIIQQTAGSGAGRGFPWGWALGALALGLGIGAGGMRFLGGREVDPGPAPALAGPEKSGAPARATPVATALRKELKAAVARMEKQEAEISSLRTELAATAHAAKERDVLQAKLAETDARLRETGANLKRSQTESEKHETSAARFDEYFRAAAARVAQPFSEFIHSARVEGPEGEARLLRDLLSMGWHHYSAVRFFSGTHDADDRYNVGRFAAVDGAAGPGPKPVSPGVKSGELAVILATASILRAHHLADLGEVSIKGRIFSLNT